MLLPTDPLPEVRMNRMCTGISNLGMAPGAGGVAAAVLAASSGAAGGGGAVAAAAGSSGVATMSTFGSSALAWRTHAPPVLVASVLRAAFGTLLDPSAASSTRTRTELA